jgi:type IV pilus assembly protein PilW
MRCVNTHQREDHQGFTLVELLVALAMAAILSVALVAIFSSYTRTQTAQENVISMQQNLRAALYLMGRDLRMAGYRGPDPATAPAAGFLTANADNLSFTVLDDATHTLTTISYQFSDSDGDGTNDAILRSDGTMANELVAENIDGVEFFYTLADGSQSTTPGTLGNIRSVEISILARTNRNDPNFSNTTTYPTRSLATWGPYDDGRRRRMGESVILFRNM